MAKSREASGNMQVITPGERRSSFLGSFVLPFLIVVAVLLTAIFFIVKTDGGKRFIADKLGKSLGMDVELKVTRIGWPYVLVIEGLSVKEKESDKILLRAESVRLAKDSKFRTHIYVNRGELILEQNSDGEWSPHVFARLGSLPAENVVQLADTVDLFDKRVVIDITDSTISWLDKNGEKKSFVSSLYFNSSPVKIQSYDMRYFYLSVKSGMANEKKFSDIEKEWLASKAKPYLALHNEDDGDTVLVNGQWEALTAGDAK